jgi:hypothetical protein
LSEFKSSLASRIQEPPRNLSGAAARAWHPITTATYAFDRRAAKLQALQEVQLRDLLVFWDTYAMPHTCKESGVLAGDAAAATIAATRTTTDSHAWPSMSSSSVVFEVWGGEGEADKADCGDDIGSLQLIASAGDREAMHARTRRWPARLLSQRLPLP